MTDNSMLYVYLYLLVADHSIAMHICLGRTLILTQSVVVTAATATAAAAAVTVTVSEAYK